MEPRANQINKVYLQIKECNLNFKMILSYPNPKKFLQKEVEVKNPKGKAPSLVCILSTNP